MIDISESDKETLEALLDYFNIPQTKVDLYILKEMALQKSLGASLLVPRDVLFCKVTLLLCAKYQYEEAQTFGNSSKEFLSSKEAVEEAKAQVSSCFSKRNEYESI